MQHLFPRPTVVTPSTRALLAGLGAMGADPYNQLTLQPSLGCYALPYATNWPDLSNALAAIYRDKVAGIPWLPPGWIQNVMALHGQNGMILIPSPANSTPAIPWLNTPEKKAWWQQFHNIANGAVMDYAGKKAAEGKIEMERAYSNAAFWDGAYKVASLLAAPVTAVRDAAETYDKYGGWIKKGAVVGLAGLVGLAIWMRIKPKK